MTSFHVCVRVSSAGLVGSNYSPGTLRGHDLLTKPERLETSVLVVHSVLALRAGVRSSRPSSNYPL